MFSRFTFVIAIIVLAYSTLLFRLWDIQITQGEYYLARASSQIQGETAANRGTISFTDKNGNYSSAATNKEFPTVYAVPKVIEDPKEAAHLIAPILNIGVDALIRQFSKPNDEYELLAKKVDGAVAAAIEDLKLKGVYVIGTSERFYPFGVRASHLLGFVGPDESGEGVSGHYGLEKYYNDALAGTPGKTENGKIISAQGGKNLFLTIDPNIQIESERILDDLVKKYGASGGSIIVEDPKTGKILAMGSAPSFDPNEYAASNVGDFLNPVVQHRYEPGSIFKVITMAAGIDAGKFTPETTYVDKGTVTVSGWKISNYDLKTKGPYGKATMTNVIEHSINTGAVFAERLIGNALFTSYVKKFGFEEKTDIGLPGEVQGDMRQLNPKSRDVVFATASYGQGIAVTPIELMAAMGVLANEGIMMRPYVNASLAPKVIRRVVGENTVEAVTQMMVSAVDKAGIASIKGYSLAGKTGTAYIPDFKKGGYTDKVIDTFVGYGPASNPRFIILIKLDGLPETTLAATSIVPAFRDLAQFIVTYYDIPPDRLTNNQ